MNFHFIRYLWNENRFQILYIYHYYYTTILIPCIYTDIIFQQSYAGKYVPAISYKIHVENPTAKVKINLKGMAIGDGLCDPETVGYSDKYVYLSVKNCYLHQINNYVC